METLYSGRVYSGSPYPSVLLQYEYQRSGADMKYRFYWKVYLENSSGWYYNNINFKIYLNGTNVFAKDCKSSSTGWSFSGTTDWYTVSNKTSGTTPCYFTAKDTQNSGWCNYTSGTFNLYVAPAYTSISSFTVSKKSGYLGITQVSVSWSAAHTCSTIQYSTDNGSSWATANSDVNASSGSFTISGLSAGTGYNFKLRVKRRDSGLTTDSSAYYQSTYQINTISSSTPNVSNGSSLNVTASNPSGASCRIRIECGSESRLSKSGTNVTFSVSEINSLMQYFTTSKTFTIRVVACTLNDAGEEIYWHWKDGTYTIINSNPIFNDFQYCDNNSSMVAITGSNAYIVKGKSKLKVTIPAANKMTAQNYATPVSYRIEASNLTGNIAYSENDVSLELGVLDVSGAINLNVSAIDSRGNITTKTKVIYVIDYAPPSQSVSIRRINEFENTTRINVSGIFSLITCGTANKNTISRVRFRYKESTATTWSSWQNLTYSITDNNYLCTQQALDLDNEKSFNFEIEVVDKLETVILPYFVAQGIPIEFINATKKNVGIGCINDKEEYSLAMRGNIYLKSGNAVLDYEVIAEWE